MKHWCAAVSVLLAACGDSLISTATGTGTCGTCNPPANASAQCVSNTCVYECASPYLKCDAGCCQPEAVAAGGDTTCAIVGIEGTVRCWGDNSRRQLGSSAPGAFSAVPVQIAGISGATKIAVGARHACAMVPGEIVCWGANDSAQLGIAQGADSPEPVEVVVAGAIELTAGGRHTCARTGSGVLCWGANDLGQLGQAASGPVAQPTAVPGVGAVASLAAGADHTCAVSSGAVVCWGANGSGQVGNGSPSAVSSPQSAVTSNATFVGAGAQHSCAVVSGDFECWGLGSSGQLGDGKSVSSASPIRTTSVPKPSAVLGGGAHSCGLVEAGGGATGVRCWGANAAAQLGIGNMQNASQPAVVDVAGVQALAAGTSHSCALSSTGGILCWGANGLGQAGTGSTSAAVLGPSPVTGK